LCLTALIVRSIVTPLRRIEEGMIAVTRGELDAALPPAERDEFGAMARALRMLRDSLIERERLEREIIAARDTAEAALRDLKSAQANLVHAEKMASLGQVTAGIAHEIKNPLNFVNNFASLSIELLIELKNISSQAFTARNPDQGVEFYELVRLLTGNLEKIVEHGRRADGIVKSMLLHSSGGRGDWQEANINDLVEDALNLSYHGTRAQGQEINVTVQRELDPSAVPIELVPQDVTRVLLNLFGNGFYAAAKKAHVTGMPAVLKVTTRELGDAIEIRVRDNGAGIPPDNRDKIFQPFFTTKPTGEGTGLGLSISYDIIAQEHGGAINVDSQEGEFSEFTIRLPRRKHGAPVRGGA
jgi:signal transduction histidine kinase